jgi:hypothetical protein
VQASKRGDKRLNSNILAKQYAMLSAEERFRLILAAGSRSDEAEGNRLMNAGKRISYSMPDHAPFAHAFHELVLLTYIELLEDAAFYLECNAQGTNAIRASVESSKPRKRKKAPTRESNDEPRNEDTVESPDWQRSFRAAYGAGYLFKMKIEGWKLFCARMNVAPLALWEQMDLPGLERLKRAFTLAHAGGAFRSAAVMTLWANEVRSTDEPEYTEANVITAAWYADRLEATFRDRVQWWGG